MAAAQLLVHFCSRITPTGQKSFERLFISGNEILKEISTP